MTRPYVLLVAASVVGVVLSWLLAGNLGIFIAISAGFAIGLFALGSRLPRVPRRRHGGSRSTPFANAAFPAYRKIEDTLFWAPVSARHFDHAVRPMLARLLATTLAERRGIDMSTEPAAARDAIGAELWELVNPARPRSDDTKQPGVPLPVVLRFVDRLEAL